METLREGAARSFTGAMTAAGFVEKFPVQANWIVQQIPGFETATLPGFNFYYVVSGGVPLLVANVAHRIFTKGEHFSDLCLTEKLEVIAFDAVILTGAAFLASEYLKIEFIQVIAMAIFSTGCQLVYYYTFSSAADAQIAELKQRVANLEAQP